MDHRELYKIFLKMLGKDMNTYDRDILKNIIAGLADKDDSLVRFYEDVTTSGKFIELSLLKNIAQNYSVPTIYEDHIQERFSKFKANLKIVYATNSSRKDSGLKQGFITEKWMKDKKPMFGSTESLTIETAGGLKKIAQGMHNSGYFEYLFKLYEQSATNVSKVKYSLLIKSTANAIEYKP